MHTLSSLGVVKVRNNICIVFISEVGFIRLDFDLFSIVGPADTTEIVTTTPAFTGGGCVDTMMVTV